MLVGSQGIRSVVGMFVTGVGNVIAARIDRFLKLLATPGECPGRLVEGHNSGWSHRVGDCHVRFGSLLS
jgi:hypothetical protein